MRVLVYGFGQYRQFEENITREIVRQLPASKKLNKFVFPVRFSKRQFIAAIKRRPTDLILGMGQCSRGRLIRIERRAANKRRNSNRERARPIAQGRPKWLRTTLRLENSIGAHRARSSADAGDYVCNFSMYVILDYLSRHRPAARFGFVHIPHAYDLTRAVQFMSGILTEAGAIDREPRVTRSR